MVEDGTDKVNAETTLLPKNVTSFQLFVLGFSIFLKGGLLGAYLPFSSLWLNIKGYSNQDLGIVSVVDAIFSLLLPLVGGVLDKLRSHNLGFVVLLAILAILKLSYIPAAGSFLAILALTAFTAPLLRASNSILDALALYAFNEKGFFMRIRLFGDLGFGCIALGVGAAYQWSENEDVIYWIFASICAVLGIFWVSISRSLSNIRPDSKAMTNEEFFAQMHHLKNDSFNIGIARALFCVWVFGSTLGVIQTFEFVLLKRLMGSGILLGLCKLVGTVSALPVWWYTPAAMDRIGVFSVQLVGLACAATRLMILGVIVNPWHALFSELLAGIGGFAIAYGTITVFAGRVVDEDMKGTAQTLIFVIFTGFGAGGSALIGGYVAEAFGIQKMFWLAGIAVAVIAVTLAIKDFTLYFLLGTYRSLEDYCKHLQNSDAVAI